MNRFSIGFGERDEPVRGHDASFLAQATPDAPMNVGGFITLKRSDTELSVDRLRTLIDDRLVRIPRFRQRISRSVGVSRWVDDRRFDVARHVDVLPFVCDSSHLTRHLADLHATPLDFDRSPWRVDLVPQGATGGPALLFRASHAIVDGLSSMLVMRSLFDGSSSSPVAATTIRPHDRSSGSRDGRQDIAIEHLFDVFRSDPDGLTPEQYERVIEVLDGLTSMLDRKRHGMPRFDGSGAIKTRIGLTELDAAALRRVRIGRKVRFDEIGLALVGAGLARWFAANGLDDREARIRTIVPIGGVTGGDKAELGNRSSFLLVALPIGQMSVTERLTLVHAEVREAVESGQHRAAAAGLATLGAPRRPPTDPRLFANDRHRFVDLVVSCVPGSRRRMRFDGRDHDITYALLPISRAVRVAVSFADIGGRLSVTLTADERSIPELDFVLDGIRHAARELVAAPGG